MNGLILTVSNSSATQQIGYAGTRPKTVVRVVVHGRSEKKQVGPWLVGGAEASAVQLTEGVNSVILFQL